MPAKYPKHLSFYTTKFTVEQLRLVAAQEGKDRSDILRAALDQYLEGKLAAVPTRRTITDGVKYRLDEMERRLTARINQFEQNMTTKMYQATKKILDELGPLINNSAAANDQVISDIYNKVAALHRIISPLEDPGRGQ